MRRPVASVRPEASVAEIARLMDRRRIGAAPVVGHTGALVGIVSKTDLVRHQTGQNGGETAADVMTPWVVSYEMDTPVEEIVAQMVRKRIHHVVITQEGAPVGIVSTLDVLRSWLIEHRAR